MTVFTIALTSSAPARADEPVPPSLIERAVRSELPGRQPSDGAVTAASWIPELRLHALVEHSALPGRQRVDAAVLGELVWPLGRTPAGDLIAAAHDRRQRSAARDSLVERIADAWHARNVAGDAADDAVAARLDAEEADAIVDALDGDGDAP